MKKILVCGSIAYDYLMKFEGKFEDCFVDGNYNLALICRGREAKFGGCGGNICYTLGLLGAKSVLIGSAGKDFAEYKKRLKQLGADCSFVEIDKKNLSSSAFIISDEKQNQVSIFDEGTPDFWKFKEMMTRVPWKEISWGAVSPDSKERMLETMRNLIKHKVPFMFDPGQQFGRYNAKELRFGLEQAAVNIVNKHEADLIIKKLEISMDELVNISPNFIITDGEKGCKIYANGLCVGKLNAVKVKKVVDPTGCGDAFRAGMAFGLNSGMNIVEAAKIATLCASFVVEQKGTQDHVFSLKDLKRRKLA